MYCYALSLWSISKLLLGLRSSIEFSYSCRMLLFFCHYSTNSFDDFFFYFPTKINVNLDMTKLNSSWLNWFEPVRLTLKKQMAAARALPSLAQGGTKVNKKQCLANLETWVKNSRREYQFYSQFKTRQKFAGKRFKKFNFLPLWILINSESDG